MNKVYEFKNVNNGEIITLPKEKLNHFFKIPNDRVYYYFDNKVFLEKDYYYYFIGIIRSWEEVEKFDLERVKYILNEYFEKDITEEEENKIIKLNEHIKKIDSNTTFNNVIKLFENGIFTEVEPILKDKYEITEHDLGKVFKYDKEIDGGHIFNFIFNELNIYDYEFIEKIEIGVR